MESLGGDESAVLIFSAVIALRAGFRLVHALLPGGMVRNRGGRLALALVPALGLAALQGILALWSARDVREAGVYRLLFELVGAVWLAALWWVMPLTGLSPRDDALEADNPAAAVAVAGAWIGALACYAGGNIGEGPTIWTTLGPAALATAVWFALWLALELAARPAEAIAVDRDRASAWRLAALLVANGALLGAGAAGDWVSADDAVRSILRAAVPAAALCGLAALAQRRLGPTPARPVRAALAYGVLPGAALLALAAAWLALRGGR